MADKKKILALIDFDGTLTRGDSFKAFMKYAVGTEKYYLNLALLSIPLGLYLLKLMPNDKAKQIVLRKFFGGWKAEKFNSLAEKFAKEELPKMVRKKGKEIVKWHVKKGHRTIIVSASPENYLRPWAKEFGAEVLSTCLEVKDGKITGNYSGKNCYGPEKVNRICAVLDPKDYEEIYAYGDSRGDREMLALATLPFYRKIK